MQSIAHGEIKFLPQAKKRVLKEDPKSIEIKTDTTGAKEVGQKP